jgi:hypothetical protein
MYDLCSHVSVCILDHIVINPINKWGIVKSTVTNYILIDTSYVFLFMVYLTTLSVAQTVYVNKYKENTKDREKVGSITAL